MRAVECRRSCASRSGGPAGCGGGGSERPPAATKSWKRSNSPPSNHAPCAAHVSIHTGPFSVESVLAMAAPHRAQERGGRRSRPAGSFAKCARTACRSAGERARSGGCSASRSAAPSNQVPAQAGQRAAATGPTSNGSSGFAHAGHRGGPSRTGARGACRFDGAGPAGGCGGSCSAGDAPRGSSPAAAPHTAHVVRAAAFGHRHRAQYQSDPPTLSGPRRGY